MLEAELELAAFVLAQLSKLCRVWVVSGTKVQFCPLDDMLPCHVLLPHMLFHDHVGMPPGQFWPI